MLNRNSNQQSSLSTKSELKAKVRTKTPVVPPLPIGKISNTPTNLRNSAKQGRESIGKLDDERDAQGLEQFISSNKVSPANGKAFFNKAEFEREHVDYLQQNIESKDLRPSQRQPVQDQGPDNNDSNQDNAITKTIKEASGPFQIFNTNSPEKQSLADQQNTNDEGEGPNGDQYITNPVLLQAAYQTSRFDDKLADSYYGANVTLDLKTDRLKQFPAEYEMLCHIQDPDQRILIK